MAKKKIDKEAERTPSSPGRIVSIFKNETVPVSYTHLTLPTIA